MARFTARAAEVGLNAPVLLFTLGLSLLTGLLFGSLPAFAAGHGKSPLQAGAVTSTPKIQGRTLRNGLMVAQLAVSFVLLTAAGLMIRSFVKLQRVDAGYNAENVLTLTLPFNWSKYNNSEKTLAYDDQILEKVSALPGVMAVGLTSGVPLDARGPNFNSFRIEGRPVEKGHADPMLNVTLTSPGAFRTLGIPLVRGRLVEENDRPDRPVIAVASQSLARHYWGNEDPLNKRISFDGEHWLTIVGIVGDIKQFGLDREPTDTLYLALAQNPGGQSLSVRTASDPMSVATLVRQTVRSIDPEQAITDVKTLTELRDESLVGARVTTLLLGLFAGLALLIAATGLTGVTAFLVSQRTREIGIRIALGAQVRQVLAMVLSHGVRLILLGAALGLIISLLTTQMMKELLYGVKTVDWPTLIGVGLVLVGVSLAASYMPARRACKIDPIVAMRTE
jgi:putative ABC transport system permease protein